MSKLDNLHALLVHELSDLHSAENQLVEALPKMASAATSAKLTAAFNDHLKATKEHIKRLDEVFEILGEKPSGEVCVAMKGLITEGEKLIKGKDKAEGAVLDAALIGAAQRVEHYEMAGYGCARTYAKQLGQPECSKILQTTLDEEGETDKKLTELAMDGGINIKAAGAAAG